MNQNIEQLIGGYLDGLLTKDQQVDLARWIEADPDNSKQFAEAVSLDNRLHAEVNATPYKSPSKVSTVPRTRPANLRWTYAVVAAVATCLLIAFGITSWLHESNHQPIVKKNGEQNVETAFASVAQTVGAEWSGGQQLTIGDRLSPQVIHLRKGFLRLAFDDGVEVTLEGPAEYELVAAGRTRLVSGLLTATVPPGAEGFRVDTPGAQVVDLGTEFGIDVSVDGIANVLVFDGIVDVVPKNSELTQRLVEGESIRLDIDGKIKSTDFDAKRFEKLWPVSSGIAGSTGAFRFVPPWPRRLRFVQSDEDVFVRTEGHIVESKEPLHVNISKAGDYVSQSDLSPSELPGGKRIRSYILHFNPTENEPRRRARRITGSISFDRPVLGLIVLHEELAASSRRFGQRAAGEDHPRRQLELTGNPNGDIVSLSEDRRTVSVDLTSPRRSSDLVRIIVDASIPSFVDVRDTLPLSKSKD